MLREHSSATKPTIPGAKYAKAMLIKTLENSTLRSYSSEKSSYCLDIGRDHFLTRYLKTLLYFSPIINSKYRSSFYTSSYVYNLTILVRHLARVFKKDSGGGV